MNTIRVNFLLADKDKLRIEQLVNEGMYVSEAEFYRMAIRERLEREPL